MALETAELRAPGVSLRRRGMGISMAEGFMATIHTTLTQGVFVVAFVQLLGATCIHYALVFAIPSLVLAVQVLSGYYLQFAERRKWFTTVTGTLFRAIWAPVLFLPFLFSRGTALNWFLVIMATSFVIFSLSANAWTGWMSELVPRQLRGRYFGRRNLVATFAAMSSLYVGGRFVDHWREYEFARSLVQRTAALLGHDDGWHQRLAAYGLVFAFAATMSLVCCVLLVLQHEPRRRGARAPAPASTSLGTTWREVIADPRFRGLLTFTLWWNFLNGPAAPFWVPFSIEHVHVSIEKIAWFGILGNCARMTALFYWGGWIDRFGSKPILRLCMLGAAIHPLFYVIASPTFHFPLYLDAISSGVMWAGIELATFKLLLAVARPERKEMYFAVYTAVSGVAVSATSLVAGHLIDDVVAMKWFSSSAVPMMAIFVFTSLSRLGSQALLRGVHEPKAMSLAETVKGILGGKPERVEVSVATQAKVVEVKGIEPSTS